MAANLPVINYAAIQPIGNPLARDLFSNIMQGMQAPNVLRQQKEATKQAQLLTALRNMQLQRAPEEFDLSQKLKESQLEAINARSNLLKGQLADLPNQRAAREEAERRANILKAMQAYSAALRTTPETLKGSLFSSPLYTNRHLNLLNTLQSEALGDQQPLGSQIPSQSQPKLEDILSNQALDVAARNRSNIIRQSMTPQARQQMDAAINSYHMFKDVDFDKMINSVKRYTTKRGRAALAADLASGEKSALDYMTWRKQIVPNLVNQMRKIEGLGVDANTRKELEEIFALEPESHGILSHIFPGTLPVDPSSSIEYSKRAIKLIKKLEKAYLKPYLLNDADTKVLNRLYGIDFTKENPSSGARGSSEEDSWDINL